MLKGGSAPKKRKRAPLLAGWVTSDSCVSQMDAEADAKHAKEEAAAAKREAAAAKRAAAAANKAAIAERHAERLAAGQRPKRQPKVSELPR